VPIHFEGDKLLLVPILDHIKNLGKPIEHQSISYFSEEDELDVFVGIEGHGIKPSYGILPEELLVNGKYRLSLSIKKPQGSPLIHTTKTEFP